MKRSILILLVIALVLISKAFAHSAEMKVTLLTRLEVANAEPVRIKDIATISVPSELKDRIGNVMISTGPIPGEERPLQSNYIRLKLNAAGFEKVKLEGSDKVVIVGKCTRITPDMMDDEIRTYVNSQIPNDSFTYDLTFQRSPREMVLSEENMPELKPRILCGEIKPGINTIAVDAVVEGKTVATRNAVVEIRVVANVLVAKDIIAQGQAISDVNTSWEQRDITKIASPITMTGNSDIGGLVARRTIRPGSTICTPDVTLPSVVKSGDSVALTVICGNVTLRTTAQAKQSGKLGDNVMVQSAVSAGTVRARVTGPGAVEILR